jgi:hypothetical protein
VSCNRPISSTFSTPVFGGSGSGSSTTNISNAPVLVFSVDPEQGDSGDRGIQGLKGDTGTSGSGGSGAGVPFFQEQYVEESSFLPGPIGSAGSSGSQGIQGNTTFVISEDPIEESIAVPGPQGFQGISGSNGVAGTSVFVLEPADPEESIAVPGPRGADGTIGVNGVPGPAFLILPDDPEEGMIGPTGAKGATGAPGGGGGSATTIEVNVSATATWRGKFTITDAAITATSKVLCWQAPGPYTSKGTRADEAELQPVQIITVVPATGTALAYWQTPPMITQNKLPKAGGQPASAIVPGLKDTQSVANSIATRIGKVRGNVKFSYLAFS